MKKQKRKVQRIHYTKAQLLELAQKQTDQLVELKLTIDLYSEHYGYLLSVILDEYPNKEDLYGFLKGHPDPQVSGLVDQVKAAWEAGK